MNNKVKIKPDTRQFINVAWARNGDTDGIITGEALILACLLHSTAEDRSSDDFKAVQKLMDDANLDDRE